eukprot:6097139-Amphidinium_carterae.4
MATGQTGTAETAAERYMKICTQSTTQAASRIPSQSDSDFYAANVAHQCVLVDLIRARQCKNGM